MRTLLAAMLCITLAGAILLPDAAIAAPDETTGAPLAPANAAAPLGVETAEELKNAIENVDVASIRLDRDIDVKDLPTYVYAEGSDYHHFKAALFIGRSLELDLNGHALTDSSDAAYGQPNSGYRSVIAIGSETDGVAIDVTIKDTNSGANPMGDGTVGSISKTAGSSNQGGAIAVNGEDSTLTIAGGSIANSEARDGGGVFVHNATVTMTGGAITGNKAIAGRSGNGGGVCVWNNGTFILEGGTISGNMADEYGGGVSVGLYGTFKMSDGTIADNSIVPDFLTRGGGGGLYADGATLVELSGGIIADNRSEGGKDAGAVVGGGVYLPDNRSRLVIAGPISISGNTDDGSGEGVQEYASNLVLGANSTIGVSALPDKGALHIAVLPEPAEDHVSIKLDEGVEPDGPLCDYFVSDRPDRMVDDDGRYVPIGDPGAVETAVDVESPDLFLGGATYGDTATVTAFVTTLSDEPVTQGSVALSADGVALGEQQLDREGVATFEFDTASLPQSFTLTAEYLGADGFLASSFKRYAGVQPRIVTLDNLRALDRPYDGTSAVELAFADVVFGNVLPKDQGKLEIVTYMQPQAINPDGTPASDAGTYEVYTVGDLRFLDESIAGCYTLDWNAFSGLSVTIEPLAAGEEGYSVESALSASNIEQGGDFASLAPSVTATGIDGGTLAGTIEWFADSDLEHPLRPDSTFDEPGEVVLHWQFSPKSCNYLPAQGFVILTVTKATDPEPDTDPDPGTDPDSPHDPDKHPDSDSDGQAVDTPAANKNGKDTGSLAATADGSPLHAVELLAACSAVLLIAAVLNASRRTER